MGAQQQQQQQQGSYREPIPATKPSPASRRAVLVYAGLVLVAAAALIGVVGVLCSTALQCTVSPLSLRLRSSGQHQSSPAASPRPDSSSWAGSSCPVQYNTLKTQQDASVNVSAPLLLGGAAAACTAGCQPRNSMW